MRLQLSSAWGSALADGTYGSPGALAAATSAALPGVLASAAARGVGGRVLDGGVLELAGGGPAARRALAALREAVVPALALPAAALLPPGLLEGDAAARAQELLGAAALRRVGARTGTGARWAEAGEPWPRLCLHGGTRAVCRAAAEIDALLTPRATLHPAAVWPALVGEGRVYSSARDAVGAVMGHRGRRAARIAAGTGARAAPAAGGEAVHFFGEPAEVDRARALVGRPPAEVLDLGAEGIWGHYLRAAMFESPRALAQVLAGDCSGTARVEADTGAVVYTSLESLRVLLWGVPASVECARAQLEALVAEAGWASLVARGALSAAAAARAREKFEQLLASEPHVKLRHRVDRDADSAE